MARTVEDIEEAMRNGSEVTFKDAVKVADHYFGEHRTSGSHNIWKMPWPLDPRVNIQKTKDGKTKRYQVEQILRAIDKLKKEK